jgi:hypothetical protein
MHLSQSVALHAQLQVPVRLCYLAAIMQWHVCNVMKAWLFAAALHTGLLLNRQAGKHLPRRKQHNFTAAWAAVTGELNERVQTAPAAHVFHSCVV